MKLKEVKDKAVTKGKEAWEKNKVFISAAGGIVAGCIAREAFRKFMMDEYQTITWQWFAFDDPDRPIKLKETVKGRFGKTIETNWHHFTRAEVMGEVKEIYNALVYLDAAKDCED